MSESKSIFNFNPVAFKNSCISGYNNVYNFYDYINKLNVFPVPDGDTGTNLNLTLKSGVDAMIKADETSIVDVTQKFSRGLLIGARGNSGVIFSQIIKGFIDPIKTTPQINSQLLATMLNSAQKIAYKAVMRPVEGTILTVIREIAEGYIDFDGYTKNVPLVKAFEYIYKTAEISLAKTPDLLPLLKEVGVVDSGGYGLVKFLEGVLHYIQTNRIIQKQKKQLTEEFRPLQQKVLTRNKEFGYCTEAIIMLQEKAAHLRNNFRKIKNNLKQKKCNSIVAVHDEEFFKVHVHTLKPGLILDYLQQYGEFKKIKVDNMTEQAHEHSNNLLGERLLINQRAIIPFSPSREIADYFRKEFKLSNNFVTGKLMNPQVGDILEMIEEADAREVYLLPNNKNCFLVAEHAAKLEKLSQVHLVPSNNFTEAIAALSIYTPSITARRNLINMKQTIRSLKTISITQADRDTTLNGVRIGTDDYFAMVGSKVSIANSDLQELLSQIFKRQIGKSIEFAMVFYNSELDQEIVLWIKQFLDENFDIEYECVDMGDNIHQIVISLE